MSGSIVSPNAGDVVGLATVCNVLFLTPALGVALVSAGRGSFKVVVLGMHRIYPPDESSSTIGFPVNIIK